MLPGGWPNVTRQIAPSSTGCTETRELIGASSSARAVRSRGGRRLCLVTSVSLSPGSALGPYEILAQVDQGGMGEVYRARDPRLGREVAIKILPAAMASDPAAVGRFEQEARAVAALSHPNILAIHDVGRAGGVAYAV